MKKGIIVLLLIVATLLAFSADIWVNVENINYVGPNSGVVRAQFVNDDCPWKQQDYDVDRSYRFLFFNNQSAEYVRAEATINGIYKGRLQYGNHVDLVIDHKEIAPINPPAQD